MIEVIYMNIGSKMCLYFTIIYIGISLLSWFIRTCRKNRCTVQVPMILVNYITYRYGDGKYKIGLFEYKYKDWLCKSEKSLDSRKYKIGYMTVGYINPNKPLETYIVEFENFNWKMFIINGLLINFGIMIVSSFMSGFIQ